MCVISRPRWGSIALQMGERAKTSDDGRADHSQPRELLILIISRCVDVGLSFLLCSINRPTLPGLLSTVSSLQVRRRRHTQAGTHKVHRQTHTHAHIFLVTPWLLVHSAQWQCQVEVPPGQKETQSHYTSFFKVTVANTHTHAHLERLLLKLSRIV